MSKTGLRVLPYLLVLATYLPFLNQAFHIDDRIYLQIAGNILEKPLYPYDFEALFEGFVAPDAASHSHLPLTSYYLSLVQLIDPEVQEWTAHLAFLIFPLLAVYGFHGTARKVVSLPECATLLFAGSTGFMVLSHTLMPDIPFIAFWLLSFRHFLKIVSGEAHRRDWVLCAIGLVGSSFLSLLSFGLILLYLSYPVLAKCFRRNVRISMQGLLALVSLPILLWAVWYLLAYLHYDRFVLIQTLSHMEQRSFLTPDLIGTKFLSFVLQVGAICVFPLLPWFTLSTRWTLPVFIGIFGFSSFYLNAFSGWDWLHALLFGFFFSTGCLILFSAALKTVSQWRKCYSRRKESFDSGECGALYLNLLFLWVFGIAFACVTVFYSGSARYVFLAVPPLILLIQYYLERHSGFAKTRQVILNLGIIATFSYSLAISYGDYLFAETYRRSAQEICSEYGGNGSDIYYTGEWGFRFYMERYGAKPITKNSTEAKPGDIIVKPYVALPWITLYDGDRYSRLLERRIVQLPYPVRILDFNSHAGFYSSGWGLLPFSLATQPRWEWFNVFQVTRPYTGEIPDPEIPY